MLARSSDVAEIDEPIHLSPYDSRWPALFQAEERRLSVALPPDIAIEHIGSTSVPGLIAKPIVDIMIGTPAHHDVPAVRGLLVSLGYEDMGEAGVSGRVYLRRRTGPAFNAALVEWAGPHWRTNLALREYLRTHPEAALNYANIKRNAFESGARSLLAYSDFKSSFLSRLIHRALAVEPEKAKPQ
jgi:GrpB-like predicted nucleotidyltransferase (UPF0157 family)